MECIPLGLSLWLLFLQSYLREVLLVHFDVKIYDTVLKKEK